MKRVRYIVSVLVVSLCTIGFTQVSHAGDAGDFLRIIGGLIDHSRGNDGYRSDYGRNNRWGRGYETCVAKDTGHEEHWGGHSSCRECLRKHGECVETCYVETHRCEAVGRDRQGYQDYVFGRGDDRWGAEERALRKCRRRGLRNCQIVDCDRNKRQTSRRYCGRR